MIVAAAYPGKAPWEDEVDVFVNGESAPGLPHGYTYGFGIPVLVKTG